MSNMAKGFFVIFCLAIATSSHGGDLTENAVMQVIARIDKAVNEQNTAALAKDLSDDVFIKMNISIKGRKQAMTASKRHYLSMLDQSWAQYSNYSYSRSNVEIDITGNKAIVSAVVKESMTFKGKNISGTSKEEVTIELVNGKPLVTRVFGHTNLQM